MEEPWTAVAPDRSWGIHLTTSEVPVWQVASVGPATRTCPLFPPPLHSTLQPKSLHSVARSHAFCRHCCPCTRRGCFRRFAWPVHCTISALCHRWCRMSCRMRWSRRSWRWSCCVRNLFGQGNATQWSSQKGGRCRCTL